MAQDVPSLIIGLETCHGPECSKGIDEPRESEGVPTLPVPESERRRGTKIGAGEPFQKWSTEERGRWDKRDPKVEQEVQKYIDTRLRISSCPFSNKDGVVGLIGKVENVLRSKSENIIVY